MAALILTVGAAALTEGAVLAHHFADVPDAEQVPLRRRSPVDQEARDLGVVIEAGGEIGGSQPLGGKRARRIVAADREAGGAHVLAGVEAALRLVGHAVEGERAVVVGEAEHAAVAPRQPPATAEGSDARRKMRGEAGGDGAHGVSR
jgi:hypothetical protein